MAIETIDYGGVMTDALDPQYAVKMRFIKGQKAMYDMNPLTNVIEGLNFADEDIAIPKGGPNEYRWQKIIDQNVKREYLGAGIHLIGYPVINGLMRLGAGIMDLLTLGVLGFSENYKDNKDKITGKIVEQLIYKYVTTKKDTPVIGVPKVSMPGGPGREGPISPSLGGAPYPGFNQASSGFNEKAFVNSLYGSQPVEKMPRYLQ
jgi:hypothetical protein